MNRDQIIKVATAVRKITGRPVTVKSEGERFTYCIGFESNLPRGASDKAFNALRKLHPGADMAANVTGYGVTTFVCV